MSMSKHLSPEALSNRWEVSVYTLARWRMEGLGPRFLKIGGQVRYRLEDIESFEHNSLQSSTSPADESQAVAGVAGTARVGEARVEAGVRA